MGIDTCSWRIRIGQFYSSTYIGRIRAPFSCLHFQHVLSLFLVKFLCTFVVLLILLLIAGDVESNPGPFVGVKYSLEASGCKDTERVSQNACRGHSVASCLSFFLFLYIKPFKSILWDSYELDNILKYGELLYNAIKTDLSCTLTLPTEFPNYIQIQNFYFSCIQQKIYKGVMTENFNSNHEQEMLSLETSLTNALSLESFAIFISNGCTFGLCRYENDIFLFIPNSGYDSTDKPVFHVLEMLTCLCQLLRHLVCSVSIKDDAALQEFVVYTFSIKGVMKNTFSKMRKANRKVVSLPDIAQSNLISLDKMQCNSSDKYQSRKRKLCVEQSSNYNSKIPKISANPEDIAKCFHESILFGPEYVCTSCSQLFFRHSVYRSNLAISPELIPRCTTGIRSVDEMEWICIDCYKKLKNSIIPPCSVGNGLSFPKIPEPLQNLTQLEERLLSPRIPFMQIRELPRGGQLGLKGNVVNVPADVNKTVRILPRDMNDSETIPVKLKRKVSFTNYIAFENIRPQKVLDAAKYLVSNSQLFRNEGITVNEKWGYISESSNDKTISSEKEICEETDVILTEGTPEDDDKNDDEDIQQSGNLDTVMHPADFREFNRILNIAPAEGNAPIGIFLDKFAEFLSFPVIYCGQTREENKKQQKKLHYSTICKWELRNVDRRVAKNIANIFFKLKKVQIKQIKDKVELAIRKCKLKGKKLTAGDILNPTSFDKIIKLDEGFRVLRTLRGSPPYWEQAKKDIFAMIKQLGIPTWFCSFSAAETKWKPLLRILAKLIKGESYTNDQLEALPWKEKCYLIKSDPVTCARYFDYRFRKFLNTVLKHKLQPIGKIQDYFYRVEFQQRGSPHIHMLIWIDRPPIPSVNSNEEISSFIDLYVSCKNDDAIKELVNYQTHRHARTCCNKVKGECRFGFPLPPLDKTMILHGLEKDDPNRKTGEINYKTILSLLEEMKLGLNETISLSDFLSNIKMTYENYITALRSSIRPGNAKVFLKRQMSEIRINNYNKTLITSWEANMDIQFILDAYACAVYIVSYISKGQRGMSNLLNQACEEARNEFSDIRQQVRKVGNVFLTHVEIGAQEAVYLLLQMSLRQSSRQITFVNTSPPDKRIILIKPKSVLKDLPKNSTSVETDSMLKQYERRPKSMNNYCLADYVACFDMKYPPKKSNSKLETESTEKSDESNELPETSYELDPIDLEDIEEDDASDIEEHADSNEEHHSKEGIVWKRRRLPKILRYVRFNKEHDAENYYRELIMLFTSWRKEEDLVKNHSSFESRYQEDKNRIDTKKSEYERLAISNIENLESDIHETFEDQAFEIDMENQHCSVQDALEGFNPSVTYGCFNPVDTTNSSQHCSDYDLALDFGIGRKQILSTEDIPQEMCDEDYRKMVQSLNVKQKEFFYHVLAWHKTCSKPLYNFLTGGAGVGKSVLLKALYQALLKFYSHKAGESPDDMKILICAPTGKAAYNVGGITIHSAFCIPADQGFNFKPLDMQQLSTFQTKYASLKAIFIDEISMVGKKMFQFINNRLQEIMGCTEFFGGVSLIAFGDLFQLKPVMDRWIFDDLSSENNIDMLGTNLWSELFSIFELDEIMRQKDDVSFAQLLNRLREGNHTKEDLSILKHRILSEENMHTTKSSHLYTQRKHVENYNSTIFNLSHNSKKTTVKAIDSVSGELSDDVKSKLLSKIPQDASKTKGLVTYLPLAEELPAELCTNVDVSDGMTNGSPCIIKKLDFRIPDSDRCSIVWVNFEEEKIGKKCRIHFNFLFNENIDSSWTPILEITRKFSFNYYKSFQITRRQFPLTLAAAKTIHKSQGSTLSRAVVDFGNTKIDHIHYVGLSRVQNITSLYVLNLNENKISTSQAVKNEMNRLRIYAQISPSIRFLYKLEQDCFTVVYHNARSLHRHLDDVKEDFNIRSADILAFSETRFRKEDSNHLIEIPGFKVYRNDDDDCGELRPAHGLAVYSKRHVFSSGFTYGHIKTIIITTNYATDCIQICFLYCPPKKAALSTFKELFVTLDKKIDFQQPLLIMGDTNIDCSQTPELGDFLFSKYSLRQIITSSTTNYGSILDHIYTNIDESHIFEKGILESYYSDHKPIFVVLK